MPIPVLSCRLANRGACDFATSGVANAPQRQSTISSGPVVQYTSRLPPTIPSFPCRQAPPSRLSIPVTHGSKLQCQLREQPAHPTSTPQADKVSAPIVSAPRDPPVLLVGPGVRRTAAKSPPQHTTLPSASSMSAVCPSVDARSSRSGGPISPSANPGARSPPHRIVNRSIPQRKEVAPASGPSSIGRLRRKGISSHTDVPACIDRVNRPLIGISAAARSSRVVSMPSAHIPKSLHASPTHDEPRTSCVLLVKSEAIMNWVHGVARARNAMCEETPSEPTITSPKFTDMGKPITRSTAECEDDTNKKLMDELVQLLDTPPAMMSASFTASTVGQYFRASSGESHLSRVDPLCGCKRPCIGTGGRAGMLERSITRFLVPTLHSDIVDARQVLRLGEADLDSPGFSEDESESESSF